jgi:cardiolipin synthase
MALSLPNLLSLLRMGLIPFFVIAVTESDIAKALGVFVIAGVTDALDGFIARFWKQQTLLGAYLDPAADKLLLTSAYVVLAFDSLTPVVSIPLWVTILVIARDVLIVTTAAALYMALETKSFPPTLLSKLTTAVQVATVVLVLLANVLVDAPWLADAALWAAYLVAALTLASGLHYVRQPAAGDLVSGPLSRRRPR